MCIATRFLEAITLRNIHAKVIVRELVIFFSWDELSKVIQSDQGSNFALKLFGQVSDSDSEC